ncbi:NlpC/P60 family protein [Synechococcales cyanobacterium C]|uniref:NlpC/P60 family protein n=1 Tax=Petrachloros mirabilis ULC683 TaxID=2781853 RepID=A0A8K2AC65_9CYAN|nr:C40 family peptidase [Petrachloros mirabilis]NCJ05655.1 NlpC/P60 family protein [Petrachloros mirabilis ULC683]
MVSLAEWQVCCADQPLTEWVVQANLNLYDSPQLKTLATQAWPGRHLRSCPESTTPLQTELRLPHAPQALPVKLCEDDYPGWIAVQDLVVLKMADALYVAPVVSAGQIQARIGGAIAFTQQAMTLSNRYLWGGTISPDYDCSGLMQAAFAAQGIWLPRDAYQQEAFTQPIQNPGSTPEALIPELITGDLIFFGTPQQATHVALHLGDGQYIHSSGQAQGRDGIGIDTLCPDSLDPVSQAYYTQVRGAGRIVTCYSPEAAPHTKKHLG